MGVDIFRIHCYSKRKGVPLLLDLPRYFKAPWKLDLAFVPNIVVISVEHASVDSNMLVELLVGFHARYLKIVGVRCFLL